jgi:hypothetical protein
MASVSQLVVGEEQLFVVEQLTKKKGLAGVDTNVFKAHSTTWGNVKNPGPSNS